MGKAAAALLIELGAKVYALSRRKPDIGGLEKFISTDLSSKEAIDNTFSQIPDYIDSFFGIAGASGVHADFLTTVKIDLISNKYITEEYLSKRMTEGGSIAFMTSTAGNGWEEAGKKAYDLPVIDADGWDSAISNYQTGICRT